MHITLVEEVGIINVLVLEGHSNFIGIRNDPTDHTECA